MSVETTATLLCSKTSVCLLFVLICTNYISTCDGSSTERVTIVGDETSTLRIATTPQGTVRGIDMVSRNNRSFSAFIGVPYAQPPIGDLRFRAAVAPVPWTDTYNATTESENCVQLNGDGEVVGDEDCLYLNVFTPQLPTDDSFPLLPVMVYILGGQFRSENNSLTRYGPEYILDQDVVLITPNFRVGVMGYFSTGDEVSPGNYGLKDIVRVLEWVQENILQYGGDPNRVTLFGGSSGAISVHILALSNLTNGLIHNYITQSGSAASDIVNKPKEFLVNRTITLGEYLGCPTNTSTLLTECLRGINATELVGTESLYYKWRSLPNNVWYPIAEPDIEGALITDSPGNLVADGKIRDLPWLSIVTPGDGINGDSLAMYEDPDLFEEFLNNIDFLLPIFMEYDGKFDDPTAYTAAIKSYYLNDLNADRSILLSNFTDVLGDYLFVYPSYKAFKRHLDLASSTNNQYFGLFNYRGVFSYTYYFSGGNTEYTNIAHGDELIYLFETHDDRFGLPGSVMAENDWKMVDAMVQMWVSFAANNTPTMSDSISTAIWEPYTSENNYFLIGNGSNPIFEMQYDMYIQRMNFWDELIEATITSGDTRNLLNILSMAFCLCSVLYTL